LLAGASLFGAGWALCGLCPGTIIAGGFFAYSHVLLLLIGMLLGGYLHRFIDNKLNGSSSRLESRQVRNEDDYYQQQQAAPEPIQKVAISRSREREPGRGSQAELREVSRQLFPASDQVS